MFGFDDGWDSWLGTFRDLSDGKPLSLFLNSFLSARMADKKLRDRRNDRSFPLRLVDHQLGIYESGIGLSTNH